MFPHAIESECIRSRRKRITTTAVTKSNKTKLSGFRCSAVPTIGLRNLALSCVHTLAGIHGEIFTKSEDSQCNAAPIHFSPRNRRLLLHNYDK